MNTPAAIASTAMMMGGIANPLRAAIKPHRISQIASKIDPILLVILTLLTALYEPCGPHGSAAPVDLAAQQTSTAAPLEQPHDDDEHNRAQKRDENAGQVEAVDGIRHLKERFG